MIHPKLIVFDLNNTLIEENSWLNLNMAMGVTVDEDNQLKRWAEEGVIDDRMGQSILIGIYKTRGDVSRDFIWRVLSKYKYKEGAEETVAKLIQKGYTLALISGAMDILVQHVAEELRITHWRAANRFIFNEDNELEQVVSVPNDVEHKAEQLAELCKELNIEPTDCMAVGDGANDKLLFETTRCGVTFKDSVLRNSAKYTISSLKDLLELVR